MSTELYTDIRNLTLRWLSYKYGKWELEAKQKKKEYKRRGSSTIKPQSEWKRLLNTGRTAHSYPKVTSKDTPSCQTVQEPFRKDTRMEVPHHFRSSWKDSSDAISISVTFYGLNVKIFFLSHTTLTLSDLV